MVSTWRIKLVSTWILTLVKKSPRNLAYLIYKWVITCYQLTTIFLWDDPWWSSNKKQGTYGKSIRNFPYNYIYITIYIWYIYIYMIYIYIHHISIYIIDYDYIYIYEFPYFSHKFSHKISHKWDDPPSHQPVANLNSRYAKLWAAPREVMQSPNIWMCRASAVRAQDTKKTPRHGENGHFMVGKYDDIWENHGK